MEGAASPDRSTPAGSTSTAVGSMSTAEVRRSVEAVPLWYHTLELPGGVITPGWFDLRPVVDRLPWPDVAGLRCLDVGTYDGFLAYELERRGAAEVLATDIPDHSLWDWPPNLRARGPQALARLAGPEKGLGFLTAHAALGSRVRREEISVYDLSPERLGHFDVVVCGSLMLHLRDPLRALSAIRSVCSGRLMSLEQIRTELRLTTTSRPLLALDGISDSVQWAVPNPAGHVRMLAAAGFRPIGRPVLYSEPLGVAHPSFGRRTPARERLRRRRLGIGPGVAHQGVLADA